MHVLLQSERQVERPSVATIENMYTAIQIGVIEVIDHYNLAPQYVRRFTVTKYHGATFKIPNLEKSLPTNEVISQLQTTVVESLLSPSSASTDDLRNVKDEGFSASISELNHTECKDDDVGLFPIQTNVVESVSPKSSTTTIMVVCDNHQVDVSDKLIYKDASGNLKDDAIVAAMFEVASNTNGNDGVTKSVSDEKDVEDSDRCDDVGGDTIEDDISKTPISICGLQDGAESEVGDDTIEDDMSKTPIPICGIEDGGESEDVCVVIEVDSSEKSFIGSSITPMKRRLPRLCDESSEDDNVG
ncbi:unnamed protein product [Lactuca virosa]|uniref:Uncharacterized protein n=1 Tax=Lactuca virosa TaxID=75947 RepID=A0AAU9NQG8_9ASTR|nr:unnamed protein product [Lactuca virosa]